MFARTTDPIPFEADGLGLVGGRLAVSGDRVRAHFRTARIVHLDALPRKGGRAAERDRAGDQPARNLGSPGREVVSNLEIEASEFKTTDLADGPPRRDALWAQRGTR